MHKSLFDIRKDFQNGFGIKSLFNVVSKDEIKNLTAFNNAIKNGMKYGEAFNTYLSNSSMRVRRQATEFINLHKQLGQVDKQTQKAKLSQAEYDSQTQKTINDLGQVTFKAKAAALGVKALGAAIKTAFNVGISLVINAIITGISDFVNKQKELEELSQQAADSIKAELASLEDYAVKVSKLRTELDEANITTERATEIRNELYEIQNDLIENYGIEKDSINLVTGSLKEQIAQIRELGKTEYESNFYSNTRATLDVIDKLNNTQLDLDRRVSKGFYEKGNFVNFSKEVEEMMSKILNDSKLINSTWDSAHWTLDTNAFDAHDALLNLQKQVEDTISSLNIRDYRSVEEFSYIRKQYQEVLNYLSDVNRDFTKPLTEHKEELVQYIKYASKYTEDYWDLVKLRSEYEIAKEKGTEEEILRARQAFNEKYNALVIASEDGAIRWYFDEEFGGTTKDIENKAKQITYPVKESLNELNTQLEEVYNSFDTAFSNQSTIQSAFDKIQSGTDLTASEMRGLIKLCKKDFPEIGSLFTKTAKGYTISADDLIRANNAIMNSVKETVESQINGYQEIVDAWENRKYDDKGFAENLGITEAEYNDAKQQIENLNRALDTLGLSLENGTDKLEEYNKVLKSISTNLATGVSAQKEMNESGKISASTLESLLSLGEDYIKCITIENGIIKFNAEEYKKLEKAKIDDKIATIELTEAEIIYNRNQAAMYGNSSRVDELNALLADEQAKRRLLKSLRDNYDTDWTTALTDKTSKNDDPIKDAFQKRQKELEHLLNMEQITESEYYKQLFDSKEYKALLANRTKYVDELDSIDEKFYKFKQDKYKEDADKQFDTLDEQFKAGKISAEAYAKTLIDLGNSLYGEGTLYAGTETAKKELESLDKKVKEVADDIYSEFKESLGNDGDLSLDNVLKDAEKLSKKNVNLFSDDPKTLKKNAEDIFSVVADSAKDALDKMLITPERYLEIIDEWGKKLEQTEGVIAKAKELSESDYLDAWDLENGFDSKKSADNFELRAERIKYIFELAEQLYGKDGQDNVKAYNELIKQGLEDEQSLVEDYYDKEIEKLEKINDEEEKRQKAIELQMNLIKARQKLEDAKKQKNQLVFHNGTFEYMEDQEAVKSAQEDVLEAEKAILEQQVEDQKESLEERKKAVSEFFNKVEGDVSGALDRIERFISGDTSVYEKPVDKADSISNESNNIIDTIGNLGAKGTFEKLVSLFGGTPANNSMRDFMESFASTLIGKQIIPTTIRDAITNNSNTTNNTAKTEIHIDKIFENLNMPQGTTKEQVEEFFKHLNQAILQRIPQVILDVKR